MQKESIAAPARSPIKQEVIYEIKQEVAEPETNKKAVEDPVKQRIKKHAHRMLILRSTHCYIYISSFQSLFIAHHKIFTLLKGQFEEKKKKLPQRMHVQQYKS